MGIFYIIHEKSELNGPSANSAVQRCPHVQYACVNACQFGFCYQNFKSFDFIMQASFLLKLRFEFLIFSYHRSTGVVKILKMLIIHILLF